jgi:hypothetical protein
VVSADSLNSVSQSLRIYFNFSSAGFSDHDVPTYELPHGCAVGRLEAFVSCRRAANSWL